MRFPAYPAYKPSGGAWLGEVPEHWNVKKLKFTARCAVSNVDKKAVEGEVPVRLCNYVEVYYREHIDSGVPFMEATATATQIEKFELQSGDVMITKDSESPDDIAVPAVVTEELKGVVCGYHLALLRPNVDEVYGKFLGRALAASGVRDHFWSVATGITRYGLTLNDIGTALVPLPPVPEQQAIAAFLDRETARIDALIAKKQRLIELLQEKRAALISHAVTRGLDPAAPLKDSGIDWLGQVPAHWDIDRLRRVCRRVTDGAHISPDLSSDDFPFVSTVDIANGSIDFAGCLRTSDECYAYLVRTGCKPFKGDVLFSKDGTVGRTAIVDVERDFVVASSLVIITPKSEALDSRFLNYWLNNDLLQQAVVLQMAGSALRRISVEKVGRLPVALPDPKEQCEIADYLDVHTKALDVLIDKIKSAMDQVTEYRASLIAHAVTGKIDVREAVAA